MKKTFKTFLFLAALCSVISACNKKEWDEYYGRPEGLGDPIYQQLEARGNFKQLLQCVDRAGYKDILSKAGYWTFFAPNDVAFNKFLQQQGVSDVSKLSDSLVNSIVKYALVYNAYRKDQIDIFQAIGGAGTPGDAFKRKTAYYDWVQHSNTSYKNIIATNRNNTTRTTGSASTGSTIVTVPVYVDGDNNNKYIPYFTSSFLAKNALSPTDYNFFYPTAFSGFNVANASVVTKDIIAENGVVHEIDEVITPLKSLGQYLGSKPEYSEFKKLLDSLSLYNANVSLTNRNYILTGSTDSVYVKSYDGRLAFSPNSENFQEPGISSFSNTASQKGSWTLLAPTNAAYNAYKAKILSKYGNSFFKGAPATVLIDFLNAHMFASPLWPSNFKLTTNYPGEPTTMELADVVDKKILSNGLFYGVSKAQDANVFRTLYGLPYLDPAYSMTYRAYSDLSTNIKINITQPNSRYTLFLMPDAVLASSGWRYNESSTGNGTTPWGYKAATSSSYSHSTAYRETILRIFKTGVLTTLNGELDNLSGSGIVETLSGDYIKWNNNKIQTSGTVDSGTDINVVSADNSAVNGVAYKLDGLLTFTEKNVGQHLEELKNKYPKNYGFFFWYVSNSNIYNKTTKAITGVNTGADNNYTIFAPNDDAIVDAIKKGWLPGNAAKDGPPTAAPTKEADKDMIRRFILYHIINGTTIAVDGKKSDKYITLLQNERGDNLLVEVANSVSSTIVADRVGDVAIVDKATSNNLSNRTLIHSINSFLKY